MSGTAYISSTHGQTSGSRSNSIPAIRTSSPASNPSASSAREHADPAQPPLQVGERLLVVEVIAREQPLDPRPVDREAALVDARDRVGARRGRPEHPVLGQLAAVGERGQGDVVDRGASGSTAGASGTRRSSSFDSSRRPVRLTDEVTITGTSSPSRRCHCSRAAAAVAASTRSAFDSARIRRSVGAAAGRRRRARARPSRSWSPGRCRPAAPGRARARAAACARRGRGTRGRARRRRCAPSISPGMSAITSCRSSASSVPSTGDSVVNG